MKNDHHVWRLFQVSKMNGIDCFTKKHDEQDIVDQLRSLISVKGIRFATRR
jgi:hypothetical protein